MTIGINDLSLTHLNKKLKIGNANNKSKILQDLCSRNGLQKRYNELISQDFFKQEGGNNLAELSDIQSKIEDQKRIIASSKSSIQRHAQELNALYEEKRVIKAAKDNL